MQIYLYEEPGSAIHQKLADVLAEYVDIEITEAPHNLTQALRSWKPQLGLVSIAAEALDYKTENCRILIICNIGSRFQNWCIAQACQAEWGCSVPNFIAIDYSPNTSRLYNQLHECLHLFGVDDCYKLEEGYPPKEACDNEKCVMRYGVGSTEVCSSVNQQIHDWKNTYMKSTARQTFETP